MFSRPSSINIINRVQGDISKSLAGPIFSHGTYHQEHGLTRRNQFL